MGVNKDTLRADLIAEIEAMEGFFQDMPSSVRNLYGLNDAPLTVRFGPDVEMVFVDEDGVNRINNCCPVEPDDLISGIDKILSDKGLIFGATELDEDSYVEIKLRPLHAVDACEAYDAAEDVLRQAASDIDLDAYGISAHWHMSAMQGDLDIFQKNAGSPNGDYSPLYKNTVGQMLTLQERFPAFFLRPFRAEQSSDNSKHYDGPETFSYATKTDTASVKGGNFSSPVRTMEPRINSDDPYQSSYLTMVALSRSLDVMKRYDLSRVGDATQNRTDYVYDPSGYIQPPITNLQSVRRGAGGYLEMLEETAENLQTHSHVFPKHVSDGMMRASIMGYEQYFEENAKAKPDEIENLDQRLWSLKQQFPEPAEERPDVDLVVT